jgi:hypothetical protein
MRDERKRKMVIICDLFLKFIPTIFFILTDFNWVEIASNHCLRSGSVLKKKIYIVFSVSLPPIEDVNFNGKLFPELLNVHL